MYELLKAHVERKLNLDGKVQSSHLTDTGFSIKAQYLGTQIEVNFELIDESYTIGLQNSETDFEYVNDDLRNYIDTAVRMTIIAGLNLKKELPIWAYIRNHQSTQVGKELMRNKELGRLIEKEYNVASLYASKYVEHHATQVGKFIYRTTKQLTQIKAKQVAEAVMYEITAPTGVYYAVILITKEGKLMLQSYHVTQAPTGVQIRVGMKATDTVVELS